MNYMFFKLKINRIIKYLKNKLNFLNNCSFKNLKIKINLIKIIKIQKNLKK